MFLDLLNCKYLWYTLEKISGSSGNYRFRGKKIGEPKAGFWSPVRRELRRKERT